MTSDYGIGAAVDIEGNCRFYDLIRLRKMCKISSKTSTVKGESSWRMFPDPTICTNSEALMGVIQGTEYGEVSFDKQKPTEEELAVAAKANKGAAAPDLDEADPIDLQYQAEKDLLVARKYSDVKANFRTLNQISQESPELPFVVQKSTISIYRFEDVVFAVYPHLAAHRRRGTSSKEVFQQVDPMAKKKTHDEGLSGIGAHQGYNNTSDTFQKNVLRSGGLNKSGKSPFS